MSSAGGDDANNNNDNPASAAAGAKSNNTTAISAPVWRNPSAAHMQKYGLVALPADFQPTPQEQMLLDMYETVKNLERAAAKIREDAARAKLDARKVEFQQKQMAASTKDSNRGKDSSNNKKKDKKKKPHRHKRVKTLTAEDDAVDDDDDDDDDVDVSDDDSEMEEEEEGKDGGDGDDNDSDDDQEKRKAAEIAALRADVEDRKKQAAVETNKASEEDARRAHHLATADEAVDDDLIGGGPVMRKKEKRAKLNADGNDDNDTAGAAAAASSALIDSLADASATPPHDFSKSLGLSPLKGMVLFPNRFSQENKWTPPTEKGQNPNEGAFMAELEDFDVTKVQQQQQQQQSGGEQQVYNNTLAVKFAVPADSRRFSINIALASEQNNDFESILFHFNPRQRERGGQLIVNDKQDGIWGQAIAVPLSQIPMIFGQTSCTLLVQITGEGFDIFIDQQHCCRLEHRTELPSSPNSCKLVVQFPVSDDYGMPEKWTVYKVWWGHVKPLAKDDVSGVPGVKSFNALHPRKLFVTGLTKVYTQADVDVRRAELERAFRKYGGGRGAIVIVPTNSTYAFVELESESATDRALREMASTYSLNRARRTKHEALQEERAAKEAKARGETGQKQRSDWD
jgi:Galactoside-binding lectin/RNA recognition motif. (a.k.a. RRM, RBD, or RNP domain)